MRSAQIGDDGRLYDSDGNAFGAHPAPARPSRPRLVHTARPQPRRAASGMSGQQALFSRRPSLLGRHVGLGQDAGPSPLRRIAEIKASPATGMQFTRRVRGDANSDLYIGRVIYPKSDPNPIYLTSARPAPSDDQIYLMRVDQGNVATWQLYAKADVLNDFMVANPGAEWIIWSTLGYLNPVFNGTPDHTRASGNYARTLIDLAVATINENGLYTSEMLDPATQTEKLDIYMSAILMAQATVTEALDMVAAGFDCGNVGLKEFSLIFAVCREFLTLLDELGQFLSSAYDSHAEEAILALDRARGRLLSRAVLWALFTSRAMVWNSISKVTLFTRATPALTDAAEATPEALRQLRENREELSKQYPSEFLDYLENQMTGFMSAHEASYPGTMELNDKVAKETGVSTTDAQLSGNSTIGFLDANAKLIEQTKAAYTSSTFSTLADFGGGGETAAQKRAREAKEKAEAEKKAEEAKKTAGSPAGPAVPPAAPDPASAPVPTGGFKTPESVKPSESAKAPVSEKAATLFEAIKAAITRADMKPITEAFNDMLLRMNGAIRTSILEDVRQKIIDEQKAEKNIAFADVKTVGDLGKPENVTAKKVVVTAMRGRLQASAQALREMVDKQTQHTVKAMEIYELDKITERSLSEMPWADLVAIADIYGADIRSVGKEEPLEPAAMENKRNGIKTAVSPIIALAKTALESRAKMKKLYGEIAAALERGIDPTKDAGADFYSQHLAEMAQEVLTTQRRLKPSASYNLINDFPKDWAKFTDEMQLLPVYSAEVLAFHVFEVKKDLLTDRLLHGIGATEKTVALDDVLSNLKTAFDDATTRAKKAKTEFERTRAVDDARAYKSLHDALNDVIFGKSGTLLTVLFMKNREALAAMAARVRAGDVREKDFEYTYVPALEDALRASSQVNAGSSNENSATKAAVQARLERWDPKPDVKTQKVSDTGARLDSVAGRQLHKAAIDAVADVDVASKRAQKWKERYRDHPKELMDDLRRDPAIFDTMVGDIKLLEEATRKANTALNSVEGYAGSKFTVAFAYIASIRILKYGVGLGYFGPDYIVKKVFEHKALQILAGIIVQLPIAILWTYFLFHIPVYFGFWERDNPYNRLLNKALSTATGEKNFLYDPGVTDSHYQYGEEPPADADDGKPLSFWHIGAIALAIGAIAMPKVVFGSVAKIVTETFDLVKTIITPKKRKGPGRPSEGKGKAGGEKRVGPGRPPKAKQAEIQRQYLEAKQRGDRAGMARAVEQFRRLREEA